MKLLFIGPNRDIFSRYESVFKQSKTSVVFFSSVNTAIHEDSKSSFDAALIVGRSINAFGETLLDLVSQFRRSSETACFGILSEERCETTEVGCMATGAIMCIQPEVSPGLAVKRIQNIVHSFDHQPIEPTDTPIEATYGIVKASVTEVCAWINDHKISLTVTESKILHYLVSGKTTIRTRDQLMDTAYADNVYIDDRTIDSHLKRLRKKLVDKNGVKYLVIETVYGAGYKMVEEGSQKPKDGRSYSRNVARVDG